MYPTSFHPLEEVLSPPTGQHKEISCLRVVKGKLENSDVNVTTSYWKPTSQELAALNDGGGIYLAVMGDRHPPVMLTAIAEEVGL